MNSLIENLNQWGGTFLSFAWPMLCQSSLLITALFAFDFLVRRKLRASIRYALWLVVLVKLCVSPTLALPTSPAWWLHKTAPPVIAKSLPHYTVTYDSTPLPEIPQIPLPVFVPPKPILNLTASLLVISAAISFILLGWLLVRWWQITRQVGRAKVSARLAALVDEAQKVVGMKLNVTVKLTAYSMSPAVCGLFRPAILIPQSLAENFSDEQLRAVLLHELIHLRRRDVWVNFFQALLQIFYWWHPLVWVANARIRHVREEAVDDAVMLALCDEAEAYAPTLLEVAKLALNRPLVSLGLVGIMESRHALRQRIERLVDFRAPRHAGLTLVSLLGILAFTAVAVPMGEGPTPAEQPALSVPLGSSPSDVVQNTNTNITNIKGILTDPNFRAVVHALQQRSGTEQLAEPEVVTSSGRGENRITLPNISVPISQISTNLLVSRVFAVDPRTFVASLKAAGVDIGTSTNSAEQIVPALKNFFAKLGVNMESPPGKAIFYGDRLGRLFVRATKDDLDTIEHAIEILNCVPPQIHIKERFLEVPTGTMAGFGNFLNATNSTTNQFTGILNATNLKLILHSLASRKDVEMLAEPEVTTTSGRQTQMRATQIITVVTNFAFQENLATNGTSSIFPQTRTVETGPILDVVPYVLADGYTINLTVIPSLTEFLGYDKPPDVPDVTGTNNRVQLPMILPKFNVRQMVATLNLWDNQTVVVGGMRVKNIIKDQTPMLGSVPLMGRMFRSQHTNETEILVFITATIVDPAGNRVHKEDELPFAQKGVPPQPSK